MSENEKVTDDKTELRSALSRQLVYSRNEFIEKWALWLCMGLFVIIGYALTFVTVTRHLQIQISVINIIKTNQNTCIYLIAAASKESLNDFENGSEVKIFSDVTTKKCMTLNGKISGVSSSNNFSTFKIYIPHYDPTACSEIHLSGKPTLTLQFQCETNLLSYIFRKTLSGNVTYGR